MSRGNYQPIIIIGAARSGTNILRDCLSSLDGFGTWPCDEINYIWKHGNRSYPNDEFPVSLASADVKEFLHSRFDREARRLGCKYLIEKTTANSLRFDFVRECFPNARYVVIYRNGFDCVSSAMDRWRAPLDLGYILKKARYVPMADIPYYGFRYLVNRISKLTSKENTLSEWGPKPASGIAGASVAERAALQWAACVRSTKDSVDSQQSNVVEIHYEEFVENPAKVVEESLDRLGINTQSLGVSRLNSKVHGRSINKGLKNIDVDVFEKVKEIISPELVRLGYSVD